MKKMFFVALPEFFNSIEYLIDSLGAWLVDDDFKIFNIKLNDSGFIMMVNISKSVCVNGYYKSSSDLLDRMKNDYLSDSPSIDAREWTLLWLSARMNNTYLVDMCDILPA